MNTKHTAACVPGTLDPRINLLVVCCRSVRLICFSVHVSLCVRTKAEFQKYRERN